MELIVLNGCGEKGQAKILADILEGWGLSIIEVENADNWGYPESRLIDMGKTPEKVAELGRRLGMDDKQVVRDIERSERATATIVLGSDYLKIIRRAEKNGHP